MKNQPNSWRAATDRFPTAPQKTPPDNHYYSSSIIRDNSLAFFPVFFFSLFVTRMIGESCYRCFVGPWLIFLTKDIQVLDMQSVFSGETNHCFRSHFSFILVLTVCTIAPFRSRHHPSRHRSHLRRRSYARHRPFHPQTFRRSSSTKISSFLPHIPGV